MSSIKSEGWSHILEAQQFTRDWIEGPFFEKVRRMEKENGSRAESTVTRESCRGARACLLFYEESLRTRASFSFAIDNLGGRVVFESVNARVFSSAAKGESLEDTIRVLCTYKPDVIVLRYHEDGGSQRAAKVSGRIPVINAGDGKAQHPTQALLDIYTIQKELGRIDGIKIAMCGDLINGRTARSLSYLLGRYPNVEIDYVSPHCAQIGNDIKEYLLRHKIKFREVGTLADIADKVDVIYQTRVQQERGANLADFDPRYFRIDGKILSMMQKHAIIMHPMPIVDEIVREEVDHDKRAAYERQAENGLFVRMALLDMILNPSD